MIAVMAMPGVGSRWVLGVRLRRGSGSVLARQNEVFTRQRGACGLQAFHGQWGRFGRCGGERRGKRDGGLRHSGSRLVARLVGPEHLGGQSDAGDDHDGEHGAMNQPACEHDTPVSWRWFLFNGAATPPGQPALIMLRGGEMSSRRRFPEKLQNGRRKWGLAPSRQRVHVSARVQTLRPGRASMRQSSVTGLPGCPETRRSPETTWMVVYGSENGH